MSPPAHDDEEIAQAVLNAFKWNYSVPDSVKLAVEKGWVALSGKVEWDSPRAAAKNAAGEILGFCGVPAASLSKQEIGPAIFAHGSGGGIEI